MPVLSYLKNRAAEPSTHNAAALLLSMLSVAYPAYAPVLQGFAAAFAGLAAALPG